MLLDAWWLTQVRNPKFSQNTDRNHDYEAVIVVQEVKT